jgi:hypothetical protein
LRAVRFLIARDSLAGPVNLSSPNPIINAEFMRDLRTAWGIRLGLPAWGLMLEAGTTLFGTESELVLKSRKVVPGKLLAAGFDFEFSHWKDAARDLCERWKRIR